MPVHAHHSDGLRPAARLARAMARASRGGSGAGGAAGTGGCGRATGSRAAARRGAGGFPTGVRTSATTSSGATSSGATAPAADDALGAVVARAVSRSRASPSAASAGLPTGQTTVGRVPDDAPSPRPAPLRRRPTPSAPCSSSARGLAGDPDRRRAARTQGFDGRVTLSAGSRSPPYDRPPLSKHLLDRTEPAWLADELGVDVHALADDVHLGTTAERLTVEGRGAVRDRRRDRTLRADAVVLATGAHAVRPAAWDAAGHAAHRRRRRPAARSRLARGTPARRRRGGMDRRRGRGSRGSRRRRRHGGRGDGVAR